ncbi:hypothetical protein QQ008_28910 [Fulvivirgaceae bacterium BMA10]|uniref:Long-chain fatty acid transport protein n=1 Tax=Splendidivirga corallicola TaxID=3051826 RepID=A0ABT8KXA5_9BACT|nr:hypothetical protein [Fulvivirgaceae bacterium BMA10]
MKKLLISLYLFGFFSAHGQSGGGSVYSIFGIGELKPPVSSQSAAMGFTSIGTSNPYYVNTSNPAANAALMGYFTHIFDFGMFVNNTQLENSTSTENIGDGGLSQLSYFFRFNNRWTGLIGLSNYSNVGYNIVDNQVLISNNNEYSVNYQGSGGLNNIYFSNSFLITKNLSLGAKLSFIFGNIFHNEIATSSQGTGTFNVENSIHVKQVNIDFGLNYLIRGENHDFNIGLIYDNGTNLAGNVNTIILSNDLETIHDEEVSTRDYSLPRKAGIGFSFRNKKFLLGTDLEFKQWSQASIGDETDLNDTWRTSFGFEYTPNIEGETFGDLINYRLGAYVENNYLNIENTNFKHWGITAGLGIPLRNASTINLSYHRKYNGTLNNGLIYESTNEFSLNVSIKERWFAKNKYH